MTEEEEEDKEELGIQVSGYSFGCLSGVVQWASQLLLRRGISVLCVYILSFYSREVNKFGRGVQMLIGGYQLVPDLPTCNPYHALSQSSPFHPVSA